MSLDSISDEAPLIIHAEQTDCILLASSENEDEMEEEAAVVTSDKLTADSDLEEEVEQVQIFLPYMIIIFSLVKGIS